MENTCHNISPEAQKTVCNAYKNWINEEIRKRYKRRYNLRLPLKLIYKPHDEEFEVFYKTTRTDFQQKIHKP